MKKKTSIPITLLTAILLLIVLSACADTNEETPQSTPESELTMTPEVEATDEEISQGEGTEPGATAEIEVEESRTPPASGLTAVIVSGDSAGTGKPFTFDATQSQAGEEAIAAYVWNMGDGTTLFGLSVEHAYDRPGFYTVTLTITDEEGQTDTVAKVVEVFDLVEGATPTAVAEFTLVSTSWHMNNAIRGTTVTLEFETEDVSGSSGCNDYSATYSVTAIEGPGADIVFDSISTGNQTCTLEIMAQEQGFLESLASASRYTIDGDRLVLETGSGTLTFRLVSN